MFSVYVLYSLSHDKIYIGFSSDLEARIQSHNILATKSYTIRYRPWSLIYTENFVTKRDAMRREKELKSAKGREFVWELIRRLTESK